MAYSAKTDWKINDVVQPEDMNRIEAGVSALDTGKADTSLSNVTESDFSTKAKASGIDIPIKSNYRCYVSTSGNDTTGQGTSLRPYKTIQKAIDSLPDSNPKGVNYTIEIGAGTHEGFTLNTSKKIFLDTSAGCTIGQVMLYRGSVQFSDDVTLTDTIYVYGEAVLRMTTATINKTGSMFTGIICQEGGVLVVQENITLSGFSIGLNCLRGQAFIAKMTMSAGNIGINCECGQVYVDEESISATTKYSVKGGGRIFAGSQTIIQA